MQKCGKEREDAKDVDLGNAQKLCGVHVVPVTELVRKDGFDLVGFALLDERVKDDDVFALGALSVMDWDGTGWRTYPWETEKVGVAVRAAFRAIDLVQVFQWELEFVR